jgi:hypothetical protein
LIFALFKLHCIPVGDNAKKIAFWFVRLYYKSRHQLRGPASAGFETALRDVTSRLGVKGENSEW